MADWFGKGNANIHKTLQSIKQRLYLNSHMFSLRPDDITGTRAKPADKCVSKAHAAQATVKAQIRHNPPIESAEGTVGARATVGDISPL